MPALSNLPSRTPEQIGMTSNIASIAPAQHASPTPPCYGHRARFALLWLVWGALVAFVVVMLLTFIVPCTVMYAMSVANVGLIMRQRLVIVAATAIFAAIYTPKKAAGVARIEVPRRARAVSRRKALA